jgi:proline iminopeptidase
MAPPHAIVSGTTVAARLGGDGSINPTLDSFRGKAMPADARAMTAISHAYFDSSGRGDRQSGGVRLIPIETPRGLYRVWTKRVGNSPRIKLLLLHGGPGATHEYFEACDSFLPGAGVEYYYYDQLGSTNSDQPDFPDLWEIPRFVDEVEQVRRALGLGPDNFYLLGHSWGGVLAIEYALRYQHQLKGLVISNMMSSIPDYNRYAREVLMPGLDPAALAQIQAFESTGQTEDPRYMELLMAHHYIHHVLPKVYVPMQGPSELGASGKLLNWDRAADLAQIEVPALVIGARHDTMDPAHMKGMASRLLRGRYLECPKGSHMALYDDQEVYFAGLIEFLKSVDDSSSG